MDFENVVTDKLALQKSLETILTFKDLVKAELFSSIVTELSEDNKGNVATLVLSYIKSV